MVKAITCASCGAPVTVKYAEQSLSCVCPACLAVLSTANESVSILVKSQLKNAKPIITLGQRYNFRGHDWDVIGYLVRSDKTETYKWSEYLLFNPYAGYRFLVCMDGHWNYVTKTKSAAKVDTVLNRATYLDKTYTLFHKGQVKTLFVLGEFYWRVKANEVVMAFDYINPPETLSLEQDADEEIWSIGSPAGPLIHPLRSRAPWRIRAGNGLRACPSVGTAQRPIRAALWERDMQPIIAMKAGCLPDCGERSEGDSLK